MHAYRGKGIQVLLWTDCYLTYNLPTASLHGYLEVTKAHKACSIYSVRLETYTIFKMNPLPILSRYQNVGY